MLLRLLDLANVKYSNVLKSNLAIPKLKKECEAWERKFQQLSSELDRVSEELEEKKEFDDKEKLYKKQKRSTEGCSKFKSLETRQVQERLASTLEHMQVPKWDRTRCPEE